MPVGKDGRWYGTDNEADYAGTQYDQDNRQDWADITHASGAGLLNNLDAQHRARRRAEADRREALAEQANDNYQECKEAIRQVFDFYRAGQIDKAVRCSLSAAAQKGRNDQLGKLVILAAVILYKQGQYKEAINCGIPFVSSLCYEKLGEKQKASQAALQAFFFWAAPIYYYGEEFESLNDDRIYKKTKFLDLCEGNTIWDDLNLPFDIEIEEFLPIVFSRAEEGNEEFYKLAGDLYKDIGDQINAKKYYDKALASNDPEALLIVGKCIMNGGLGYEKDKKLGKSYINKYRSLKLTLDKKYKTDDDFQPYQNSSSSEELSSEELSSEESSSEESSSEESSSEESSSSENEKKPISKFNIIGAVALGLIGLIFGFIGCILGAVIGWFVGGIVGKKFS